MAQVIENLITRLTFDVDQKELDNFDAFLGKAAKGLTKIVAAATAAATAVFFFTKSLAESTDQLGKFGARTGIDIEALQELGFVAELNGGSIDSMNSSLENLNRIASEAARGVGAGVEAFGMLGISVTDSEGRIKTADVLFNNIADSIQKLGTQAQRLEFASRLGIGPDLLIALQQGSEAIMAQRQEARELGFILDREAAVAAAAFNDEWLRLTRILGDKTIFIVLIKTIQPVLKNLVEWLKLNRAIIRQNIVKFLDFTVATMRALFNIGSRVVRVINSLTQLLGGWKVVITTATAALIAFNANALLIPTLWLAAAFAVFLFFEDFVTYLEDGDSALGNLAKRFETLDFWLKVITKREGWEKVLAEGAVKVVEDLRNIMQDIREIYFSIIAIQGGKIGQSIRKFFGLDINTNQNVNNTARPPITFPQRFQQGTTTTNNDRRNITININGGNKEEIRQELNNILGDQYSSAKTNLESNVES
jgi:hypothetical protein